jgi:isoleucyl-tRNA synthetase
VAGEIASLTHDQIAAVLDGATISAGPHELSAEDLVVVREPREGTVVATEGSLSVALDVGIDEELRIEGVAREIINRTQSSRRDADLDVVDRITLHWSSDDADVVTAFERHGELISGEVLATSIVREDQEIGTDVDLLGATVNLEVRPVEPS